MLLFNFSHALCPHAALIEHKTSFIHIIDRSKPKITWFLGAKKRAVSIALNNSMANIKLYLKCEYSMLTVFHTLRETVLLSDNCTYIYIEVMFLQNPLLFRVDLLEEEKN